MTDGAEIYTLLARQHTTTDLSPGPAAQIGRDDLSHIHAEMRAIIRARGGGETLDSSLHRAADP